MDPVSDYSHLNDQQLVQQTLNGNKDGFRLLFERYQDRLFHMVFAMVRGQEQAEDLTQEIFAKAYFALSSYHGDSSFYTWLYRIAANHCVDQLRKQRPSMVSLDKPLNEESEQMAIDHLSAPAAEDPRRPLEDQEISALLSALEPDHCVVLTLREIQGHSYEEIAQIMNCGVNTIKSRINRAREAMKAIYVRKYGNILTTEVVKSNEDKSDD